MDLIPYLDPKFGTFPEPVLFIYGGQVAYTNESAAALLDTKPELGELACALAEHPAAGCDLSVGDSLYFATVSEMDGGELVVLRPQETPEEGRPHPFSAAVKRMRESLTLLASVQQKLRRDLPEDSHLQDMATQSKLLYQMLRLVRHTELTEALNDQEFPMEEGFDLGKVCEEMAAEVTLLADLAGVTFTYSTNAHSLPYKASKSLLTQMLLAVISNGVRAAGRSGTVEMKLHAWEDRCVISVKDTGTGIPPERMAQLFSGEVDEDSDIIGTGIGLYNARRIAMLHGGVLIIESGLEGGCSAVISLPSRVPPSVPERNNPGYDHPGGYSPVLIELSDVLPWQAFTRLGKREMDR